MMLHDVTLFMAYYGSSAHGGSWWWRSKFPCYSTQLPRHIFPLVLFSLAGNMCFFLFWAVYPCISSLTAGWHQQERSYYKPVTYCNAEWTCERSISTKFIFQFFLLLDFHSQDSRPSNGHVGCQNLTPWSIVILLFLSCIPITWILRLFGRNIE